MLEGARKLAQTLSLAELLPDDAEVEPAAPTLVYNAFQAYSEPCS